VEEEAKGHRE